MRRLLFFYATWCPVCRFYEKEYIIPLETAAGRDKIQRVNAQEEPFEADKYMIDRLPAIVLLDGNKTVTSRTGAIDVMKITEFLKGADTYGNVNT